MSVTEVSIKIQACRVCRETNCVNAVLLNGDDQWCELFEFCIGVQVNIQDEPRTLCVQCANSLCRFAEFKKQCLKSDSFWKSLADNSVSCHVEKYEPDIIKLDYNDFDQHGFCIEVKQEIDNTVTETEEIFSNENKPSHEIETFTLDTFTNKEKNDLKVVKSAPKSELSSKTSNNDTISTRAINKHSSKVNESGVCLTDHKKQHTKENKEIIYKSKTLINKRQSLTPEYLCGLCRFTDKSQAKVLEHFKEHVSSNDLECKICDFVGRDFAIMVSHRLLHNTKTTMVKLLCPICKMRCLTKLKIEFHYRSVHLNEPGGYCFRCDKEFAKYGPWKYHIRGHAENKFICDMCGKKFSDSKAMIIHMRLHSVIPNCVCHVCGKGFSRTSNLTLHMNTTHVNGHIQCSHCGKFFKNSQTLKFHLKRLKTKSSLKCEHCSKCFAIPYLLKEHKIWHANEKPYSCEVCGSCFKAKSHLKTHIRNHSGVKPFSCELCNKCFLLKRQLQRHASVHSGVRPYKCPHCDRSFHYKKQVRVHCAQKHKSVLDKANNKL